MDWTVVVAAGITAIFAFLGTWLSNRKQSGIWEYRLKQLETNLTQLETKLDRHNSFEARIVALETKTSNMR